MHYFHHGVTLAKQHHQHRTAGGFYVYLFVAIIVAHSALITDAFFHHNVRVRTHRSKMIDNLRVPASLDNATLDCDNADESFAVQYEQHFIFMLENRRGTCLDPRQYLHIEINRQSYNNFEGGRFLYDLPSCGNIVKAMSPDPVTGRLEFTVKAKKKLRRGWKLAIYSVYGRWNNLGQISTRIGDIFIEDKDFYKNYDGPVLSYECFVDSSYKSTYWEEAEGEKVKIGTEICTIVAQGLPVKDEQLN